MSRSETDSGRASGLRGSSCVAVVVIGLSLAIAGPAGAAPLKPDLQTLNPSPLRICKEKVNAISQSDACKGTGRTVFRMHGYIANAGLGPLEYAPVTAAEDIPADCHGDGNPDINGDGQGDDNDVLVRQRTYNDANGDGIFTRSIDTGSSTLDVGCRYYHPAHSHYHVEAFAQFSLQSVSSGDVVAAGQKISFCVADTAYFNLSLPGALQPSNGNGYYSDSSCNGRLSTQGISVGWDDHYGWKLSGQEIDITGMPAGDYCLIAQADPDDRIDETNETNNEQMRRLFINPSAAPTNGYIDLPSTAGCPTQGSQHTLTVQVQGPGTVTGPGIACPGDCSETYDQGSQVALTSTPTGGGSFAGWSGACTGTGGCALTMNGAKQVTASFSPPQSSTQILRPNADLASAWSVIGASAAWSALDDPLVQPSSPDATDYIQPTAGGQATEVGVGSVPLGGATPQAATAFFFGKTYKSDTRLEVQVRWGGVTRETFTLGFGSPYAWRQIPISPVPPDQASLDDLSLRFTALDGTHATVRAAYVKLDLP